MYRIVVDVLATEAQDLALQTVLGEAICAAPDEHDGPCRIAWQIGRATWTGDESAADNYGLDAEAAQDVSAQLRPIEVWSRSDVDRSLGLA